MSKMWSSQDAVKIADMFDSVGLVAQANILDQYARAAISGDVVKQAGLWERFKGWAKSKIFDEYKELVQNARAAQKQLDERMDSITQQYKDLQSDLKNYRLNDWRVKVNQLNDQAKDVSKILGEFDKTYGNFLQAVIGIEKNNPQKQDEQGQPKSVSQQVAELFSGEAANPVQQQVQQDVKEMATGLTEWSAESTKANWIETNHNTNEMRVNKSHAQQANAHLAKIQGESGPVVMVNYAAKGQRPAWMIDAFGRDTWEHHREDQNWLYFRKVENETANAFKQKILGPEASVEQAPATQEFQKPELPQVSPEVSPETSPGPEVSTEIPAEITTEGPAETQLPPGMPVGKKRGPKPGRSKKEWQVLTRGPLGTVWVRPKTLLENPKYEGQKILGKPEDYPVLQKFMDHPNLSAHLSESEERRAEILNLMLKNGANYRIGRAINILLKE